jgi:FKBP-type peptidyl-prolyl cis-trans isomerase SlyD
MNHPLAGLTLVFDLNIADVRPATEEEIAHGHAH